MAHGYMRDFDEDRGDERERWRDADRERGWRDEGRDRGSWRGNEPDSSDRNRSFMLGSRGRSDWERAPRNFSSHQDDHYRSWRDKQMQGLDRDYEDYCREREQQFHSDFDAWRSQRRGQEPLRTGMTQTSQSGDPTGELELSSEMATPQQDQPDAMGAATMGTTSSRGRR
jgi:hypothetical protein